MKQTAPTVKDQVRPKDAKRLSIELSIVVPTFNEKDNVEKLIEGMERFPSAALLPAWVEQSARQTVRQKTAIAGRLKF